MTHGCHGTGLGRSKRDEVGADFLHLVAVAHPYRRSLRYAIKETSRMQDMALRPSKLTLLRCLDLATQRLASELHPVANAKYRNLQLEYRRIALGSASFVDTGWAAGKDHP